MSLIALNGSNLAPSFGDDKSSLAGYALLLGARFTICCDYNRCTTALYALGFW